MTDAPTPPALPVLPAEPPRRDRHPWRIVGLAALILVLVATTTLSAYLWLVSSRWIGQNDTLRAEATEIGEQLAESQAHVADLETQVDTLQQQLDTASETLSDVVNDEARAGDDVQYLGDLIDAYASCASEYDDVLTDALTNGYTYSNSNARSVQGDISDYCDSLAEAYTEYKAESK